MRAYQEYDGEVDADEGEGPDIPISGWSDVADYMDEHMVYSYPSKRAFTRSRGAFIITLQANIFRFLPAHSSGGIFPPGLYIRGRLYGRAYGVKSGPA